MRLRTGRVLVAAAACLALLSGCETSSKLSDLLPGKSADDSTGSIFDKPPPAGDADTTGSITVPPAEPRSEVPHGLLGNDPNDDLNLGKKYFRTANFGLAERHFRRAVELHPRDAEAWVGLAATYDRLRRFDLADRAYKQAIEIIGPTPELLNNQGYSYMLRGDYGRSRKTLLEAQAKDPNNPYIRNNLELLDKSFRKGKAVQ